MALNSKAKQHYDNAAALLSLCDSAGDDGAAQYTASQVLALAARAEAEISCAHFAVENHALVMGIDTDVLPAQPGLPGAMSGPKVWGA